MRNAGQIAVIPLLLCCLASCRSVAETPRAEIPRHSATIAVPRGERWVEKHLQQVRQAADEGVELLFLGDSITRQWTVVAPDVWTEFYGHRKALNLGNGGDRTEHTLWRVEHGEIERLPLKLVVLLIGTNNLVQKDDAMPSTPREIADGVSAIVQGLRRKLPETHILVQAIFPRGKGPRHRLRQQVAATLPMLAELADGKRVHFLDVGGVFVDEQERISGEIMPDALHLSSQGYRLWAENIEETVSELLAEPR